MPTLDVGNNVQFTSGNEFILHASKGIISLNSEGGAGGIEINAERILAQRAGGTMITMVEGDDGGGMTLQAYGKSTIQMRLYGNQTVESSVCITKGGISIVNGAIPEGSRITVGPKSLEMSVGPDGGGAIKISKDSIILQVGDTKLVINAKGITQMAGGNYVKINSEGVSESVGEARRTLKESGHHFTVAEASCEISPLSIDFKSGAINLSAEAAAKLKGSLEQGAIDGIRIESSGMIKTN